VLLFVELGDDARWERGLGEGSKERVTWCGQCEAPCAASKRLQRALDVTEDGVGEFRGKEEEGEGRKKRGPPCVQHRARAGSVSGDIVGSSGPGARTGSVEAAGGFWTAMVLKRGKVCLARPSESETRHCTPMRYMYAYGMSGAFALSS